MTSRTTGVAVGIRDHLETLVRLAPRRPPGSPANWAATSYVTAALRRAGLAPELLPFRARYWRPGRATIDVNGRRASIDPPPFCRTTAVAGAATRVSSAPQLAGLQLPSAAVIVLAGDFELPIFPKAFPFVSVPEQVSLIERLEALRPAAVLAVRPDDAAHEPAFEDPDLAFPYATILASLDRAISEGAEVRLEVSAAMAVGDGVNVSAGCASGTRAVVSAHVDSKVTTDGALDNGGGVATLLEIAELGLEGLRPTELVFFNGEDHYAAPGEQAWLAARDLAEIELVVNVDGAGLAGHGAAVSLFGGSNELEATVNRLLAAESRLQPGAPWFESDHTIFAVQGIPAIAITSAAPFDDLRRRSHAPDSPEDLDPGVLAAVAGFIRELLVV